MSSKRRWLLFWLWMLTSFCVLGSLLGCSGMSRPASSRPSAPFFMPTAEDAPRLQMLTDQLDTQVLKCVETVNCAQIFFARGLVSLFENQDAARASFHHVIEHNPASALARSSTRWLWLMDHEERAVESNKAEVRAVTELAAEFVRQWMEHEVTDRQTAEQPVTAAASDEQPGEPPRVIQGLQKQVRDRDRQIAVLRGQLEALKAIDQDHMEKQRKVRVPTSLRTGEPHVP